MFNGSVYSCLNKYINQSYNLSTYSLIIIFSRKDKIQFDSWKIYLHPGHISTKLDKNIINKTLVTFIMNYISF